VHNCVDQIRNVAKSKRTGINREDQDRMISFLCSRNLFHEEFNERSFKRMTEEKDSQKEERRKRSYWSWKRRKIVGHERKISCKIYEKSGRLVENYFILSVQIQDINFFFNCQFFSYSTKLQIHRTLAHTTTAVP
jgi:hypothetical protein